MRSLWTKGSFARALLIAFLAISIVPLLLILPLFTNQSTEALTAQMENNLLLLVQSRAEEINIRLTEVLHTTLIATQQAAFVLQQDIDDTEIEERLARYQPDHRNILGLDIYYSEAGGAEVLGEEISNVYWNNEVPPTEEVARQILITEVLDPTFQGVKSVSPDTQWIYMTTPEGMMRLYPWASNDHYPDNWDPREIIFYTVAAPENNPNMETRWTAPYVDYAGAGWMVTVSSPIMSDNGEYLGIMSHDITIQSLKEIALNINVLDGAGFGFLIDQEGNVIAHPDFQSEDATAGTQEETNLLEIGTPEFRALIQEMTHGEVGLGSYIDESDEEQILVYAPIPSIGWRLGIAVPKAAVVAPAMTMRNRILIITFILVAASSLAALLLARRINRPVARLLAGVNELSQEHRPETIEVRSFSELQTLANAFNNMAAKVWERESRLKARVKELTIEIDSQHSQEQLAALTETDYFQYLEQNAERIRNEVRGIATSD